MLFNFFSLRGLRQLLRKFADGCSLSVDGRHWSISKDGYDKWWELYYDDVPVADCVCGELYNCCLEDSVFRKIKKIVESEYGVC